MRVVGGTWRWNPCPAESAGAERSQERTELLDSNASNLASICMESNVLCRNCRWCLRHDHHKGLHRFQDLRWWSSRGLNRRWTTLSRIVVGSVGRRLRHPIRSQGSAKHCKVMTPTLSESDSVWNIHSKNRSRNGLWCLFAIAADPAAETTRGR